MCTRRAARCGAQGAVGAGKALQGRCEPVLHAAACATWHSAKQQCKLADLHGTRCIVPAVLPSRIVPTHTCVLAPCAVQESVGIAESELPLRLPDTDDFKPSGTPDPPLAKCTDWVATTDPQVGACNMGLGQLARLRAVRPGGAAAEGCRCSTDARKRQLQILPKGQKPLARHTMPRRTHPSPAGTAGASRDEHHASVGGLLLVLPALHRPPERQQVGGLVAGRRAGCAPSCLQACLRAYVPRAACVRIARRPTAHVCTSALPLLPGS